MTDRCACAPGCQSTVQNNGERFCPACYGRWLTSRERERWKGADHWAAASATALADFARRRSAELLNGGAP